MALALLRITAHDLILEDDLRRAAGRGGNLRDGFRFSDMATPQAWRQEDQERQPANRLYQRDALFHFNNVAGLSAEPQIASALRCALVKAIIVR
jgi:hypothetical protein